MKTRKYLIISLLCVISFYLISLFAFSTPKKNLSPIRIAIPKLYSSALMIVAQEAGFFKKNGLDVTLGGLTYGRDCIEEMLKNNYDYSVAYVTPIAKKIHAGEKFSIITELHNSTDNTLIVYRKDFFKDVEKEISSKKIGLVKGTNAEFLLSLFAGAKSIDHSKLNVIDASIEKIEEGLISGELGSAIFWQPRVHQLLTKYPNKLGVLKTPFYTDISALVGNNEFLKSHSRETYTLVKSLTEAKAFFDSSPLKAKSMVLNYLNESTKLIGSSGLNGFNIDLRLSQIFVVMLESEMRWMSRSKFKFIKKIPKELLIRKEFLETYLPTKVTYQ